MIGVLYVSSHKLKSICCCQERKEFVLLGLIIQDLGFWLPRAKHRWVSMPVPSKRLHKSCYTLRRFSIWIVQAASVSSQSKTTQSRIRDYSLPWIKPLSAKTNINHSPYSLQYLRIFPQQLSLLSGDTALTQALAQTGVSLHCSGWQSCKRGTGSELNHPQWEIGWTPWSRRSACHWVVSHRCHLVQPTTKKK